MLKILSGVRSDRCFLNGHRLATIELFGIEHKAVATGAHKDLTGSNKLVEGGYQQAVRRIKSVSCPQNARRLNLDTPCGKTGSCNVSACAKPMCSLFLALERAPGGKRTQVLLVDEELGY